MLVGLAAIGRDGWLSRHLPGLAYLLSGRLEIGQSWADEIRGADAAKSTIMPAITPIDAGDSGSSQLLNEQIEALAHAWAGGSLSEVAVRSAATAFAIAKHRSVPLLSHRAPIVRAATASDGTRRVDCVGGADLAIWLARSHLEPAHAWEFYEQLSATIAGEQHGWRVPHTRGDFLYFAREAAAGRT